MHLLRKNSYERLSFKFLQNRVSITIHPQTSQTNLNICYNSISISRRYLKISPVILIGN